jgi:hypothetical protein
MKTAKKFILFSVIAIVLTIAVIAIFVYEFSAKPVVTQKTAETADTFDAKNLMADVIFDCTSGLSFRAAFYDGPAKQATSTDMPPIPGGKLRLTFSDGRQLILPQTISADGARYANADESLVFWDKGDEAMWQQAGQETDTCKVNKN